MSFIPNTLCKRPQLQYWAAMSDIDEDYVDVGENVLSDDINDNLETAAERTNGKKRGKDIEWLEVESFNDKSCYENSAFF